MVLMMIIRRIEETIKGEKIDWNTELKRGMRSVPDTGSYNRRVTPGDANGSACRPRLCRTHNRMHPDTTVNTIPRSPNPYFPPYANHPSHRELPGVRPPRPHHRSRDGPSSDGLSPHGRFLHGRFPGAAPRRQSPCETFYGRFPLGYCLSRPYPRRHNSHGFVFCG